MVVTKPLLFGALISSAVAFPLIPDPPLSSLQQLNISTANIASLPTHAHPPTLTANFRGKCFTQNPPSEPQWPPTRFADCALAIAHFADGRIDLNRPVVFSRTTPMSSSGIQLPKMVNSGTCAVMIDVEGSKNLEMMTVKEVMDAAWTLATKCVHLPAEARARIGGSGRVGDMGLLEIKVYGVQGGR